MLQYFLIGVLGLSIFGAVSGSAPQAIDLVPGQIYRTGSPLSQPGIIGLIGGIAGTHRGGDYERWNGPYVGAQDEALGVAGYWTPATAEDVAAQNVTYTHEQAQAAQDRVAWNRVENKQRAVVPDCAGQLTVTYVPDAEIGATIKYGCQETK